MWVMMKFYCRFSLVQKMAPISSKFYLLLIWLNHVNVMSDITFIYPLVHPCRTSSCDRQTQHLSPPYGLQWPLSPWLISVLILLCRNFEPFLLPLKNLPNPHIAKQTLTCENLLCSNRAHKPRKHQFGHFLFENFLQPTTSISIAMLTCLAAK